MLIWLSAETRCNTDLFMGNLVAGAVFILSISNPHTSTASPPAHRGSAFIFPLKIVSMESPGAALGIPVQWKMTPKLPSGHSLGWLSVAPLLLGLHLSPAPDRECCDPQAVPAPRSKHFHEGNPFVLLIWLSNRTWLWAWSWHQMKNVHFKHFILTLMGMGNSLAHFLKVFKQ